MYTAIRYFFRYGNESDPMDCTWHEYDTIEKAINYAHRYAKGIRFAGVVIEDEKGNEVYEINSCGDVYDYRNN